MSYSKLAGWGVALLAAQKDVKYRSQTGAAAGSPITVADVVATSLVVAAYNVTDKAVIDVKACTAGAGTITIAGVNTATKTVVFGFITP